MSSHRIPRRPTNQHEWNAATAMAYLMDIAQHDIDGKPLVAVDLSGEGPQYRMVIAVHDHLDRLDKILETIKALYPTGITATVKEAVEFQGLGALGESHAA